MRLIRSLRPLAIFAAIAGSWQAACRKDKPVEKDKPVAPVAIDAAPPAASGQPRLKVVVDGKEIPMAAAVVSRAKDQSLHFEVVSTQVSCTEALQSARVGVAPGDVSFTVHAENRLAPDGTFSWVAAAFGSKGTFDFNTKPTISISGDPTKEAELTIQFTLDADPNTGATWKRMQVEGTMVAKGCGDRPVAPDHPAIAKATHPSTATVTIAGQKTPIVSAWRYQETTYLSTEPSTCSYAGLATRLSLAVDQKEKMPTTWRLEGSWMPGQLSGPGEGLVIKPGKKGEGPDGPTIELALSGATKFGDYAVELAGAIEALACKERK